jgi:hypothetical protein
MDSRVGLLPQGVPGAAGHHDLAQGFSTNT